MALLVQSDQGLLHDVLSVAPGTAGALEPAARNWSQGRSDVGQKPPVGSLVSRKSGYHPRLPASFAVGHTTLNCYFR